MKIGTALGLSLAVHALLAAAAVVCIRSASRTESSAVLDVTSVELSLAEEDAPDAVTAAALPGAEVADSAPSPRVEAAPPLPQMEIRQMPPEFDAMRLPDPEEPPAKMDLPEPEKEVAHEEPSARKDAAAAPAPKQARIDAPLKPKRKIRPEYPRGSRERGEQGDVTLEFEVDADGTVKAARVVESCGFPDLESAAIKAMEKARFTPAQSGGRAVATSARLTLSFRLK